MNNAFIKWVTSTEIAPWNCLICLHSPPPVPLTWSLLSVNGVEPICPSEITPSLQHSSKPLCFPWRQNSSHGCFKLRTKHWFYINFHLVETPVDHQTEQRQLLGDWLTFDPACSCWLIVWVNQETFNHSGREPHYNNEDKHIWSNITVLETILILHTHTLLFIYIYIWIDR